jgi:hypothetical protein
MAPSSDPYFKKFRHAVVNGRLDSSFGEIFEAEINPSSGTAMAS